MTCRICCNTLRNTMTLSIISRRAVLALLLAVPLIAAQRATDPVAQYNVTVSPWVNHRVYAPLSLPVGSQLNFEWNGAHGVYLIPTDQCPEPGAFPPGPNELYAASAMNSMNNILSVNLTSTGTYYFACQVGDHCLEDGQKLVVTVTNATAGTLSGFNVLSTA
uniref:Putative extracellular protein TR9_039 n=1 Tax=Trebouxia lynnae TaxID=1825957 RepID=A0A7L9QEG2_9CHLO|nr:putative extracellular protein TR9_039 [Trebouxia lynnae]